MLINNAFAATAEVAAQGSAVGGTLLQLALILLIFYFFLIRPQRKRMYEHTAMVEALKVKDEVILSSGIYGKVAKIKDEKIAVEIAPNVEIWVDRMYVGSLVTDSKKTVDSSSKKQIKK